MAWPRPKDANCQPGCTPLHHMSNCKVAHGEEALRLNDAIEALNNLVKGLVAGDPEGPFGFHLPVAAEGHYARAMQVLRDNGRVP